MEAKFKIDDAIKFTKTVENKYTLGDEGRIDVDGVFERNGKYFYNVKSAGHLITDVPEDDMNFVYSSVEKNVDEYLRNRDAEKTFKDSDVRVSGSRKEMMAYKGMINAEDLENIEKDKVIARKLIKKDKVYPQINTTEQIDKGVSGGCLFLKMKARDFVHSMPPDTEQFRKLYVGLCQWVYEVFNDAMNLDDFEHRRKYFINGIIRKSLLISNPELEGELILQNKQYEEEAAKYSEYHENYKKLKNKIYELAEKANIQTWEGDKMEEAFPEQHKELEYWNKLRRIADQFGDNKILPLEYRFLHNLILVDEEGEKKSILTSYDVPQGEIGKSKNIDDEYVMNYSGKVRDELIEAVFGEKFYMFIKKQSRIGKETTYKVYEESKKYEAFTEEQYQKEYESQIKPVEETIEKYTAHIKYLSDPDKLYKDKFNYALTEAKMGGWRWGRSKYNFEKMIKRGDVNEAVRLMEDIVKKPNSGFHEIINGKNQELKNLKEKYFVRDNNYSFLEKGERKKVERTELTVNSSEPLSYIKRVGGIAIYDEDLNTQDALLKFYKNILGITRITFGLTITDIERKAQAHYFAGSMLDMAEAINWDIKSLTSGFSDDKGKSLGIMFAAAGRGKAMAHFQSDTNAINLTRSKGDGSVAHEMVHFIDNNVQRIFPKDRKSEKNHSVFASYTKGDTKNVSNEAIQSAFESVMRFIKKGISVNKKTLEVVGINRENEMFKQIEPMLPEFIQSVISAKVMVKIDADPKRTISSGMKLDTIEDTINQYKNSYPNYFTYSFFMDETNKVKKLLGAIVNTFGLESYTFEFSNDPKNKKSNYYSDTVETNTLFYLRSSKMKSDYWTFDWELTARSAECFFQDAMEKQGRSNNYLVSGVNFSHGSGVYPQGIEREILFVLYSNLFNVIKRELNIPDFKAFRDDRTDEYLELPKDEEENENVIVVDEQTKEVIDGDVELMKQKEIAVQKMNKLKELLSKSGEKFEDGGKINSIDGNKLVENLFSFSKQ